MIFPPVFQRAAWRVLVNCIRGNSISNSILALAAHNFDTRTATCSIGECTRARVHRRIFTIGCILLDILFSYGPPPFVLHKRVSPRRVIVRRCRRISPDYGNVRLKPASEGERRFISVPGARTIRVFVH